MLEGLMQNDFPLTLQHVRRRMRACSPDAQVITLLEPGEVQRASFAEVSERIDRLARALGSLGVRPGDRVATFAWNNQRHFELYFAIPCVGAVLHTLNIRLFEEQLTYIVNHAEDKVIFIDDSLVGLLEGLAPTFAGVEHYVVMGDGDAGSLPNAVRYLVHVCVPSNTACGGAGIGRIELITGLARLSDRSAPSTRRPTSRSVPSPR